MDGIEDNGVADEGLAEDGSILNSAGDFPSTLDYVNAIRARHNAPPLEFDDEAADHASQCVQAGMDAGSMGHRYGLTNDGIDDGQCISFGTVNDYFVWTMKTGVDGRRKPIQWGILSLPLYADCLESFYRRWNCHGPIG